MAQVIRAVPAPAKALVLTPPASPAPAPLTVCTCGGTLSPIRGTSGWCHRVTGTVSCRPIVAEDGGWAEPDGWAEGPRAFPVGRPA